MGTCEPSDELVGSSPQILLADGAEATVVGYLGERVGGCVAEPLASVDNALGASLREGDGLFLSSVSEKHSSSDAGHGLGPLEAEELNTLDGCDCANVNPELGNVSNIEVGLSRMRFDEIQCETNPCLSNPMDCSSVWAEPEPLSGSDNVSQAPPGRIIDFVSQSISDNHCWSDSNDASGPLEVEARNTTDGCPVPADGDKTFEVTADFDHGHAGTSNELGNVSSIEVGLSRIFVDEVHCISEMNPCSSNKRDNSSELQQVPSAPSCSTAHNELGCAAGGDNPCREILVDLVPKMDDGSSKGMLMPNGLTMNHVAAVNFTHACESSNYLDSEADCRIESANATSSSLRRSSRTRKCVQKVQVGKHANKSTKKASNLSQCGTVDLLSTAVRKKRSCLSRSLCSSGWGFSANLSKYFERSNELIVNNVLDKVSKKGRAGQRSKKKNVLKAVASSQTSGGIQGAPCRPIRLKVTFGKKEELKKVDVMPCETVDPPSVLQSSDDGNKPDVCSYSESTMGKPNCINNVQSEPQMMDGLLAGKYMDPGTSPDSEVIDQVPDSNVMQSTPIILHDPVNITSNGMAVPGNASSSTLEKSNKKKSKKDKTCKTSNASMEDKAQCQAGVDKAKKKKRNKKDKICESSDVGEGGKVICEVNVDKATSKKGRGQKISNGFCITGHCENPLSNTSGCELISTGLLSVSEQGPQKAPCLDNGAGSNDVAMESADSGNPCMLLSPDGAQGKKISKGSKAKGKSKNKCKITDTTKKQEETSGQLKGSKRKVKSRSKMRENDNLDVLDNKESQLETGNNVAGNCASLDVRITDTGMAVVPENVACLDVLPAEVGKQILSPRVAWVCCDDCHKWRCIPAELADAIEDAHCRWTCKDNQDQAFADCSIPQEKSNTEINAELQISDEEDGHDGHLGSNGGGIRHATVSQPSTWMLIKSNLFLHRSRKTQTMDEIMVCHCKLPADGALGCGNQCLNRMLNIECVQGTCPCGDLCSNQQFQKRQYAQLNWFRCGKKGYGLQASEDISKGQFLIEYVGEVLDLQAYEARQRDYASKGYKHFYFMTLNGNEVIDACAKGNLGRFVNHSCDPNCRTEKWVVNGEICVGLFALKNIRMGEELTFDYNYVRVFGAAAKKCHCGSSKCRGYIGGDPNNSEVIVQADSDEEFPEPVVIDENGEIDHTLEDVMAKSRSEDVHLVPNADDICQDNMDVVIEKGEVVNKIDIGDQSPYLKKESKEVHKSPDNLVALETEHVKDEILSTADQLRSTREQTAGAFLSSPISDILRVKRKVKKSLAGPTDSGGRISEADIVDCNRSPSKPRPRMKISRLSKSVKNRKSTGICGNEKILGSGHKSQLVFSKPRKLPGGSTNCHLEAVEEKLNELLDAEGGICKRKDASKGYLKLLLLTAASGDSGGTVGAIQSNRDLSMILDAMLKTKSRGVLLDIINKNGLQMLHNMMKLYRRDFNKIPILRKLLKVLEFLAEREILTVERINGDPLCPGVESFRESILSFTEHMDKKVHQIARNFRDRWIPRSLRKFSRSSNSKFFGTHHQWRDHGVRSTEAIDLINKQSAEPTNPIDPKMTDSSATNLNITDAIITRPRKRKSRWDQDRVPRSPPQKLKTSPTADNCEGGLDQTVEVREEKNSSGYTQNLPESTTVKEDGDPMETSEDEAPPGFPSPHVSDVDAPPGFSALQKPEDAPPPGFSPLSPQNSPSLESPPEVFPGCHKERFNSRLPVSYGIPFAIMQKFGSLRSGTLDGWVVAPAIPFQPFPPLPPYPRDKSLVQTQAQEEMGRDQGIPSTSGLVHQGFQNLGSCNQNQQHMSHQERGFPHGPGRRHNRQHYKWNNHPKWRRPWLQRRNRWGFKGNHHNHHRNGMLMGVNMMMNEQNNNGQHLVDVNHNLGFAGNS